MKSTLITAILITTMGILSFFKKSGKPENKINSTILGMVLLKENNTLNVENTINELRTKWNLSISTSEADNQTAIIEVGKYRVAIANIPAPIPGDEVEVAAQYNYMWDNAVEETTKHKGHIIVTIMNSGIDPIEENLLFSKIVSSVMNNSESIGIYIGSRTLVLNKEFFNINNQEINNKGLPIYNWLYFGLRQENEKYSIYTYGLEEFGKREMEILNSNKPVEQLQEMMYNVTHYVLAYDVTLKSGETIGISAEQKLKISESAGKYVQGKTLKIQY